MRLAQHAQSPQLLKVLRFSGVVVPPGYEIAFQRALWAFRHCRWGMGTMQDQHRLHDCVLACDHSQRALCAFRH